MVNGALGGVTYAADGSLFAVMGITIRDGRIVAMNVLADPERLRDIDLTVPED